MYERAQNQPFVASYIQLGHNESRALLLKLLLSKQSLLYLGLKSKC